MPSLGHAIVGLAAARRLGGDGPLRLVHTAASLALATFPDLDVLARRLGAQPGSPWLHRGLLHSLAVAAAAGLLAGFLLGPPGRPTWRLACIAAAAAASHGLLDTLTSGGAGVMLLWPFSGARVLSPWALAPAAPMGLRLLSSRGADVALRELLLLAPLLAWAAWPRRPRPGGAGRLLRAPRSQPGPAA